MEEMMSYSIFDAVAWEQRFSEGCGQAILDLIRPLLGEGHVFELGTLQEDLIIRTVSEMIELGCGITGVSIVNVRAPGMLEQVLGVEEESGMAMNFSESVAENLIRCDSYYVLEEQLVAQGRNPSNVLGGILSFLVLSRETYTIEFLSSFFRLRVIEDDAVPQTKDLVEMVKMSFWISVALAILAQLLGHDENAKKLLLPVYLFRAGNYPICVLENGTLLVVTDEEPHKKVYVPLSEN